MNAWYIIETNPNCEEKATRELRRAGMRVYLPKCSFVKDGGRKGKPRVIHRPLLVGYLLVRFPRDRMEGAVPVFGIARKCQGVRDFVRFKTASGEDEPFPIPGREVADLMSRQRSREFGQVSIGGKRKLIERRRQEYSPGMKLRVVEGPFLSFVAQVDQMRKSGEIEATIQVFGRPTKIVLDEPEKFLRAI